VDQLVQALVSLVYTDGEHEYTSKVLLSSATITSAGDMARKYLENIFAEGTSQDRNYRDLFWAKGDTRNVKIISVTLLNAPEFNFLKHYLDVTSVQ